MNEHERTESPGVEPAEFEGFEDSLEILWLRQISYTEAWSGG